MIVRGPRGEGTTGRYRRGTLLLMVVGTLGAACSLLVDAEREQCTSDAQCVGHLGQGAVCAAGICQRVETPLVDAGKDATADASTDASSDADAAPNPTWDCVAEELPASVPIHVFARYRSFAGGAPLAGLEVTGCPTSSVNCSPAVSGTPKDTGSDGLFEMITTPTLPGGFRGTLETAASGSFPKLLPSILAVKPGTSTQSLEDAGPGRPRYPTDLLTSDDLQAVADALGSSPTVEIDPNAGHLVFVATNCQDELAAGVTVKTEFQSASTRIVYLDENGQPKKDLKQTSSSGRGIFLNLPVAQHSLTLTREDGQEGFNQTVPVRKGVISYTFLSAVR